MTKAVHCSVLFDSFLIVCLNPWSMAGLYNPGWAHTHGCGRTSLLPGAVSYSDPWGHLATNKENFKRTQI